MPFKKPARCRQVRGETRRSKKRGFSVELRTIRYQSFQSKAASASNDLLKPPPTAQTASERRSLRLLWPSQLMTCLPRIFFSPQSALGKRFSHFIRTRTYSRKEMSRIRFLIKRMPHEQPKGSKSQ